MLVPIFVVKPQSKKKLKRNCCKIVQTNGLSVKYDFIFTFAFHNVFPLFLLLILAFIDELLKSCEHLQLPAVIGNTADGKNRLTVYI